MDSSQIVSITALAVLVTSVVCDLRSRTIPDSLSIALLALGLAATSLHWHDVGWAQLGFGVGGGFAIGALLFYVGAMGGGDAKLFAGLGAVCGWSGLFEVLFATALCGGLMAYIARRRNMDSLPYAPAIAVGYLATIAIVWSLPPRTGL